MSYAHVTDELYELLGGDLSNHEMVRVNDHLKGCERCRQELIDVSMAHALLTSVSDILAPEFAAARRGHDGQRLESDLPALEVASAWCAEREMRSRGGSASPVGRSLANFDRVGYRPGIVRTPTAAPALPVAASSFGPSSAVGPPGDDMALRRPHRRRPTAASTFRRAETVHLARHRSRLVAVVVAVLLFATLFGVGSWQHERTSSGGHILLTAVLLPLPAAPSATGRVTVRSDGDVTVTTTLKPAGTGRYYEVWLIDPGDPKELPLGILPASGTGRFTFPVGLWGRGFAGVAISLQVAGASSSGIQMLSTAVTPHRVAAHVSSSAGPGRPHARSTHPRSGSTRHRRDKAHGSTGRKLPRALLSSSQAPPALRKLLADSEPFPTSGPVLRVTTTSDSNAVDPLSGRCRDSAGRCSLRAAIEVANARRTPIVIRVPAGTYVLTLGPLVASDPAGMSIEGASPRLTIVTAAGKSRLLVVEEATSHGRSHAGAVVSLTRLTLRDGFAASSGPFAGEGGAVLVSDGADVLELSHVSILDSHAAVGGGGLYSKGQLWATAATFRDDSAGGSGGAVALAHSEAVVTDSVFSGDSAGSAGAVGAEGGAVEDGAAALVLVYSSLTGDSVEGSGATLRGGALDLRGPAWLASDVFLRDHVQTSIGKSAPADTTPADTAPGGRATASGGAVFVGAGAVSIEDSTFDGNEVTGAAASGGAVFNAADLNITGSRFVANEVTSTPTSPAGGGGGAIYDAATLTLAEDVFSRDRAAGDGGAIDDAGVSHVADSEFSWNRTASDGGAIYDGGALILVGSTLSHNLAGRGAGLFVVGALMARGDAIVDNRASGPGAAGGGLFVVGGAGSSLARTITLYRSTIAGNIAPAGAGVAEAGGDAVGVAGTGHVSVALISRSVISGNSLPSGAEQDCAAIPTGTAASARLVLSSGGGNVVGDTSCDLATATDREGPAAQGYWLVSSSGIVRTCKVTSYGTVGGRALGSPVVALAAAPGGDGYWEATADGAVHNFGSARSYGSALGRLGHGAVAGFAGTLDGGGYWLVTSDGVVFNFGDAGYYGSAVGAHVVAMARSVDGRGYWLLEADGTVLAFGDAPRLGDHTGIIARAIGSTPDGEGYWVAASDGEVFSLGDAPGYGRIATTGVIALLPSADGRGYLLVTHRGQVFAAGDAPHPPPTARLSVVAAAT
ncbi:MAG: hypothetical protein ABSE47_11745 [Acidimicrobiales bacterium]